MGCKLGILTRWVNYIINLLNGIIKENFNTNAAVSIEIINGANS